jgi:hypothetical protein
VLYLVVYRGLSVLQFVVGWCVWTIGMAELDGSSALDKFTGLHLAGANGPCNESACSCASWEWETIQAPRASRRDRCWYDCPVGAQCPPFHSAVE